MSVSPGQRVVLIVGGSSGIGLATAQQTSARGDEVAILARDLTALNRARETLSAPCLTLVCDVTDAMATAAAVATVIERFGRLDAVVHTAQVMAYGRIEDVPADVFDEVVDVALHGTANVARAVLPIFRRQSRGTLVIVNSLLGEIVTPRMGAYNSAKWGQLGMARALQLETRKAPGIDVCIVSPGAVDTPIYDQAASYAGRQGCPPPPVVSSNTVARAIVKVLDRPRRHVEVGPANQLTRFGFRAVPMIFDRVVGVLVDRFVFRGPTTEPNPGNVLEPRYRLEQVSGGWSRLGRRMKPR